MKKEIASRLNKIAEKLPTLFQELEENLLMKGSELLLTPLEWMVDDPKKFYPVTIPKFVAVEHKQQLKDAYKRGGWRAVDLYSLEILYYSGALKGVDVIARIKALNPNWEEKQKMFG